MRKWMTLSLVIISVACVGACAEKSATTQKLPTQAKREFEGTIVSLRPTTETMLISKGKKVEELNMVAVKWDRQTLFFLDGQKADLTQIQQYMPVRVKGRMVDGQMVADEVWFGSALPANVKTK